MQLFGLLDVGITIVVTFALTGLLCTTINELLVIVLRTRGNTLHRTVSALLDDEKIRAAFFNHGLIKSLGIGSTGGKQGDTPPSTMVDTASRSSYIDGRTFADALLGSIEPGKPIPAIEEIKTRVDQLEDGQLKAALALAVASAGDSITGVRDELVRWFDSSMDRLSGYYTRYMKWVSLVVGIVLAVILNIDTIQIAAVASADLNVSRQGVAIAENLRRADMGTCAGKPDDIDCRASAFATTRESLGALPIGWSEWPPAPAADTWWWLKKIVGWLITALAASVGAPFWFDVLQNVMSLRGAGTKRVDPVAEPSEK